MLAAASNLLPDAAVHEQNGLGDDKIVVEREFRSALPPPWGGLKQGGGAYPPPRRHRPYFMQKDKRLLSTDDR